MNTHHRHQRVEVQSYVADDAGRLPVIIDHAWMERWTVERLAQAVADGDAITENEGAHQ